MIRNLTILCLGLLGMLACSKPSSEDTQKTNAAKKEKTRLKVMAYNLWHGGDAGKQPLEKTMEVIQKAGAEIVGISEPDGFNPNAGEEQYQNRPDNSKIIAEKWGWHHFRQKGGASIISKYKIVEELPNQTGVKIELPNGKHVYFFNAHFIHIPYQPYQLAEIKYGDYPYIKTEEEAIRWANEARKGEVETILTEMNKVAGENAPMFMTGDFNEPSHLDWTEKAAEAGVVQIKVEWPATKAFEGLGFVDAYRTIFPDEAKYPGDTWTPLSTPEDEKNGEDVLDRIDFVLVKGEQVKVLDTKIVGEVSEYSDIKIENYPSDHRAVVSTVELTW
ncbi:endonuclease/exonuclease/phosphatase family protein [Rapidithrix thailandica]|uniref:Endonuclease/exonuclease/phosphatase family protein n=1 Tax=Rapidithrix thailandica TaxID=413964 RepID=A0AAW9RVW4_9BACT